MNARTDPDLLVPAHDGLDRLALTPVLFAQRVSRRALLGLDLPAPGGPHVAVNVWRNHAFEPLLPLVAPYAAWGRWQPDCRISGYDDTLAYEGWQPADVELLWLDRSRLRLAGAEYLGWLAQRLQALRALTSAPVVLCTWTLDDAEATALQALAARLPGVHLADIGAACAEEAVPLVDARSAAMAGTPLSAPAQLLLARRLACHWLPAAALPPLKALALDLDHTLHAGVLGEDGVHGVVLTPAHAALQAQAQALRAQGIFLALVSRNEAADVQGLFDTRTDYPLRWSDFSATEVSWGGKDDAVARVAHRLRIAPQAVLFVDDNAGELARVATSLPGVPLLHAQVDAAVTQRGLVHVPGLWRWQVGSDDAARVADLQANDERERLAATLHDAAAYLANLQVRLTVRQGARDLLPRLHQLCVKTNQFNLSLRRLAEAELAALMDTPQAGVAAVGLADRLSDSGIVGVVVAERAGTALVVQELCISCRAMGRGLEDPLVLHALRGMPAFAGCETVVFRLRHAERNGPARAWLQALLGLDHEPAEGDHVLPAARLRDYTAPAAITIEE